jgi:hypothetical protein
MLPAGTPPEQAATIAQAEQGLDAMPIEQIAEMANSPFAEDWQKDVMKQYLEYRMKQVFADPRDNEMKRIQLELERRKLAPEPKARPATPEERARYGIPENTPVYIRPDGSPAIISDGKTTIDNRQMGNIPPGYQVEYDEQGRPVRMIPIPGSPAANDADKTEAAGVAQGNKRLTMTDTVTSAADKARALIGGMSTGLVGQGLAYIGITDAAEVKRQVDVLKSNASIENLTAMRRESPTGGALGAVSDKENAMLASAAGALDPSAGPERFAQALDNYELTLMRIIHGYEAGTQIFEKRKQERASGQQSPQQPATQQGGYDVDVDQLPENTPAEGEDGRVYMKRNGKLWVETQEGWEEVR